MTTACTNNGTSDSEYPTHPISWIVPYDPGGGSDIQVRRLQPYVEKFLDARIHIVYKPGGDGAAGWQQLRSATPDGYTLGNVVAPNIMQLAVTKEAGFKANDFRYVTWTESESTVLTTGKDCGIKTMRELVRKARAHPGTVTIAGVGQTNKIDLKQIEKATGTKLAYVPVGAGAGAMVQQLQGCHVDAAIVGSISATEYPSAERAVAVASAHRSKALPKVPTLDELGYKGYHDGSAWGLAAPPGTPDSVIQTLNKALNKAVRVSKVQQAMKKEGLTPMTMTPRQAKSRMKTYLGRVTREASKYQSSNG